jgi:hypothetical protein
MGFNRMIVRRLTEKTQGGAHSGVALAFVSVMPKKISGFFLGLCVAANATQN